MPFLQNNRLLLQTMTAQAVQLKQWLCNNSQHEARSTAIYTTSEVVNKLGKYSYSNIKGELQCENKLISYERASKMLENERYFLRHVRYELVT